LPSYIFYRLSFITEDSYEGSITNPLSLNLYTYCNNNPVINVDPSGHISISSIVSSVGKAVSSVAKAVSSVTTKAAGSVTKAVSSAANTTAKALNTAAKTVASVGTTIGKALNSANDKYVGGQLNKVNNGTVAGTAKAMTIAVGGAALISGGMAIGGMAATGSVIAAPTVAITSGSGVVAGERVLEKAEPEIESVGVKVGDKVFRVWGSNPGMEGSAPWGHSWSTVDPSTVLNFRNAAGLPSGGASGAMNAGRFVSVGEVADTEGIVARNALTLDGMDGGLPELLFPNPTTQIILKGVYGINPEY